MRRTSDSRSDRRTGRGRRARDRLLSGEPPGATREPPTSELENLLYFVGDDLREATLAMGGIEQFLLAAHRAVASARPPAELEELGELLREAQIEGRMADLDQALGQLVQSLSRLRAATSRP